MPKVCMYTLYERSGGKGKNSLGEHRNSTVCGHWDTIICTHCSVEARQNEWLVVDHDDADMRRTSMVHMYHAGVINRDWHEKMLLAWHFALLPSRLGPAELIETRLHQVPIFA